MYSVAPPLDRLPQILAELDARQDGAAFRTAACLLCPATWLGQPAMVKVTDEPEELRGLAALIAWNGAGAVRVLHRRGTAAVLERAGTTLRRRTSGGPAGEDIAAGRCAGGSAPDGSCVGGSAPDISTPDRGIDDDLSTRTLCTAIGELHRLPVRPGPEFVPLADHLHALTLDRHPLYEIPRRLARDLLQHNEDRVLLHGDVHAENLLDSEWGWLFIDPKGIVGPRSFDYANIFTNWTLGQASEHFETRLATVVRAAELDEMTMLRWIAVWGAVSGIWSRQVKNPTAADLPHAVMELALARLG